MEDGLTESQLKSLVGNGMVLPQLGVPLLLALIGVSEVPPW